LTTTSYKYVDVGISVGPVSSVEIVIGDNHGINQIIMLHAMWEMFIEKHANIEQLPHFITSDLRSDCGIC